MVELAIGVADLADAARRVGDPKLFLTASRELRTVMAAMGGSGDGCARTPDGGAAAHGDAAVDELAELLGSGPEMGDTTQP